MLNIIIPHYNNYEGLKDLLKSLSLQTKKTFKITVVDDCSNNFEEIKELIKKFSSELKIELLQTPKNGGPGAARQYGLDNINEMFFDYVAFADSDDFLLPRAVELLYKSAKRSDADVVSSPIICEQYSNDVKIKNTNWTWLHGKIYKVSFLKQNNICFPNIRANEDVTFNILVNELAQTKVFIDDEVYLWRNNKDSITRKDNFYEKYGYLYIEALICAYQKILQKKSIDKTQLSINFPNLYKYYQISYYYGKKEQIDYMNKILKEFFQNYPIINYINDNIENIAKSIDTNFNYKHKILWFKESFPEWFSKLGGAINGI